MCNSDVAVIAMCLACSGCLQCRGGLGGITFIVFIPVGVEFNTVDGECAVPGFVQEVAHSIL